MKGALIFHLSLTIGRTDEDNWEILELDDILFWENNLKLIKSKCYSHDGCSVNVSANWDILIERLKESYRKTKDAYSKTPIDYSSFVERKVQIPVSVEIKEENKHSHYISYARFFVDYYLYELFVLMNLARPGVCDFFNLSINDDRMMLSSYNFQNAWLNSFNGHFPRLKELPLSDVISWYEEINIGYKQKASLPIEKALFSLIHFCHSDDNINGIMWIFHALEAIFSTKFGEGFSNLIERISFLLTLNEKERSLLRKNFRLLYDLRSSLIHGGYEIYHPMRYDLMDDSLNDQFSEIYKNLQFGVSVIISCLQVLISNNWYGINIEEKINGKPTP
ncbi:hypothetical protein BBB57_21140 [Kosakonia sacchari]|uniref:Apea-like HEPN domain-containing protein n=1 Tax=Kosakonia sacchari TaxID=1158459 RepID=A0A1G4YR97_9ENTR|nr:HEPN domain-containing protein [Kosakonia sacchari]AHJ77517.1 hypothetical protein C813_22110 [Kosakonia sacchari SP1]ANR80536.1 hypothetical protein BBB57_21140 [Kosakonia sacchari]SCX55969.1 hypothetical protein SAMN02927897_03228 [Kosakonia sacchari]